MGSNIKSVVILSVPKRPSLGALRLIATVVAAETNSITNNIRAAFQFKFFTSFVGSSKMSYYWMGIQKFICRYLLESDSVTELVSEILDEMHRRIVQSFLDFVILLELSKHPLSGDDIISLIHKRHHMLMSADTIHSYLNTLERDGLVKSELNRKNRVYNITECGNEAAREFLDAKTKILGLFLDLFICE